MSNEMKVTLTLRTQVAERLRAMCHLKGETASEIIDRWILTHDNETKCRVSVEKRNPMEGLFDRLRSI